ncbi:class I SAM-dependent methyltransferase [Streptomyces bauhiniae]|uniref:class I SAM-dependent methyltransferase n=1 Tax=Streptomyces bauhiniae TaxID=2340725 RepID=UPI003673E860
MLTGPGGRCWSADVVGLDLSEAQLTAAVRAMGVDRYPLVQGAAEQLPFAADSFDLVFCDFGGLSWAPPHQAVPQAARVLRRGGRLVFNVAGPWFEACPDPATPNGYNKADPPDWAHRWPAELLWVTHKPWPDRP